MLKVWSLRLGSLAIGLGGISAGLYVLDIGLKQTKKSF